MQRREQMSQRRAKAREQRNGCGVTEQEQGTRPAWLLPRQTNPWVTRDQVARAAGLVAPALAAAEVRRARPPAVLPRNGPSHGPLAALAARWPRSNSSRGISKRHRHHPPRACQSARPTLLTTCRRPGRSTRLARVDACNAHASGPIAGQAGRQPTTAGFRTASPAMSRPTASQPRPMSLPHVVNHNSGVVREG